MIIEDNDPTGYKSRQAIAAKEALGITTLPWPKYSPELNPLDYSLWDAVESKALEKRAAARETVETYKRRLRSIALSLSESFVRKSVEGLPKRLKQVIDAKGYNIPRD